MADIVPPNSRLWQDVETKARRIFDSYCYHEIRTPIVESTELFKRGVGEATALVEKEMYSFADQGGESLTLRPEGTAPVARAHIESGAFVSEPLARYYYIGPMFRRERPQKGRQRQFHQIGCELMGVDSPLADAEVMAMTAHFFGDVGLKGFELEVNSIGCMECRPKFNASLLKFLEAQSSGLCDDCARRITRNPMRALDCKKETCRKVLEMAPRLPDFWCSACRGHLDDVKHALDLSGVSYKQNDRIVRGLDYYMRTAFEFISTKLGAQNAIAAGGRYDGLVKAMGGPDVPGVGIAIGMERLILLLNAGRIPLPTEDVVFFAVLGNRAREVALPIIQTLRRDGVRIEWDYATGSLKGQMRRAGRLGAKTVVIIGDNEIERGEVLFRDMRAGTQRQVRIKDLPMHFVEVGG